MFAGQLLCLHTFVLAHGGRDLHHMARASQLYMDYTVYECVVICIYIYANGDYTGIQYPYFPLYFKGLTAKRNVWLKCPNTRKINRASVACH